MNILITGIHGFVGSNLVTELKEQHTIYGLDIFSPHKNGVVKTFGWNELEQLPPFDAVIHLAGKAHDTKNTTEEKAYFDINVGLTQKIFEYFLKSNASKFIFFSSVKAVADNVMGDYLTEEALPNPQTAYGKSKLEAEQYLQKKIQQYDLSSRKDEPKKEEAQLPGRGEGFLSPFGMTAKKQLYILRPSMIHGPGNKGNLNLLFKIVKKGIPWPLGAFQNNRSFTSIDNLNFIINEIIEKDIEPGVYNISDDETLSTNEIIKLIAISQNKKPKIWNFPTSLIKVVANWGDLLHLPLNSERLKKLTESYVVSNDKIKRALGIEKIPTQAKDGMQKTLSSFK